MGTNALLAWGVLAELVHFTVGGFLVSAAFPSPTPARATGVLPSGFAYHCYASRNVITFTVGHLSFGVPLAVLYRVLHSRASLAAAWGSAAYRRQLRAYGVWRAAYVRGLR